jgi:hypothetical protein
MTVAAQGGLRSGARLQQPCVTASLPIRQTKFLFLKLASLREPIRFRFFPACGDAAGDFK